MKTTTTLRKDRGEKLHFARFKQLPYGALLLLSVILLTTSCKSTNNEDTRPNVIVIMADDLGYETIGANGGTSYNTPQIDRMAEQGMRFEHCYAQPLCTPSRVKLMTGIYNVRNYVRFGLLEKNQTTFGHLFQEAGYRTGIIGKWQLGKDPKSPGKAGFDQHCLWQVGKGRVDSTGRDTRFSKPVLQVDGQLKTYEDNDYGPDVVSQYGLDFIEQCHEQGQPFMLYYPMLLTHCPFSPTPLSPEWMKDDTTVMRYKGQPHYFKDMVYAMDSIIGSVNRKLKELGIEENTLVIFTGDNGTDTPIVSMLNDRKVAGAKGHTIDAGTRVPLVVKWPEVIEHGKVYRDLTDLSDFLPTICEAADIPIPDSLKIDGVSFLPQLQGKEGNPREWIYCWYSRQGKKSDAKVFARTHRYKLYKSGEFYEVPEDYREKHPLDLKTLTMKEKKIFQKLENILNSYERKR